MSSSSVPVVNSNFCSLLDFWITDSLSSEVSKFYHQIIFHMHTLELLLLCAVNWPAVFRESRAATLAG